MARQNLDELRSYLAKVAEALGVSDTFTYQGISFLRYPAVQEELGGVSRRTVERMVRAGRLPPPIKVHKRLCGWPAGQLYEAIEQLKKSGGRDA